jgi:hypothetical protein
MMAVNSWERMSTVTASSAVTAESPLPYRLVAATARAAYDTLFGAAAEGGMVKVVVMVVLP